jgi:hypothetical protein
MPVILSATGDNIAPWRTDILAHCSSLGVAIFGQYGAVQLVMSPADFQTTFGTPPTVILTPSAQPVAGVNYPLEAPAATALDPNPWKKWAHTDKIHQEFCVIQLAVRNHVISTLSTAHQTSIHGNSDFGLMPFSSAAMVTTMSSLYFTSSTTQEKLLEKRIAHPYRQAADNLHAHIAGNLAAVEALSVFKREGKALGSAKYKGLRDSIQQANLVDDLKKHFDYDHPTPAERTYEALTAHLLKHAPGVMEHDGDPYAPSHAHAVTDDLSGATAMAAHASDPAFQQFRAFQAFQAAHSGTTTAPPSSVRPTGAASHHRPQQTVPAPKPVPSTVKYCWVHGYSTAAKGGHAGHECNTMKNTVNRHTNQSFTPKNISAAAHSVNTDGSANGSFKGYSSF